MGWYDAYDIAMIILSKDFWALWDDVYNFLYLLL
jgi:hypothetical protein